MKLTRFSIAGLMVLVLVFALGLVGLKEASPVWASTFFTVTLLALVVGVLNAVQGQGRGRAFWIGFAISGWIYFLCVFGINSESGASAPPVLFELLFNQTQPLFHPQASYLNPMPIPVMPPGPIALPAPPAPVMVSPPTPLPPPATVGDLSETTATISIAPLPAPPVSITGTLTSWPYDTIYQSYHQVGHSLAALLVAYLGGSYSLFAAARRERRENETNPTVSPSSP